jgi:IS4 transposase
VQQAGAKVVARLNPYTLRVCDANRKILRLLRRAKKVPKTGALEFNIIIPIPPAIKSKSHKPWSLAHAVAWLEARVVAARTRHGEIIWIITTLAPTEATAVQLLELYRLRWQIEMLFKRLKSLLHLDTLPSRQGPTARSWMLARLLAAALSQKLVQPSGPLSPYGYQVESPRLYA